MGHARRCVCRPTTNGGGTNGVRKKGGFLSLLAFADPVCEIPHERRGPSIVLVRRNTLRHTKIHTKSMGPGPARARGRARRGAGGAGWGGRASPAGPAGPARAQAHGFCVCFGMYRCFPVHQVYVPGSLGLINPPWGRVGFLGDGFFNPKFRLYQFKRSPDLV